VAPEIPRSAVRLQRESRFTFRAAHARHNRARLKTEFWQTRYGLCPENPALRRIIIPHHASVKLDRPNGMLRCKSRPAGDRIGHEFF
jgi:hypothetical protein